ncbi:ribonuclease P protein component [Desulfatiglans anilini]|uniref:ribonuclease P protein component n=1 Tax=Desulfatiglans anilini TaxID=90728 RepID=UPI0003F710B3|nr:ribonuclease P protein component [Desulfatiglans anilini]VBB46234.1 Ribonuclease P protein component [uncultured Desulfatiglans sp.]
MGDFSLPKNERLLARPDFIHVDQLGKRRQSRHFVVKCLRNGLGCTRLGVTASRRTGNAVQRNRAKRLMREFFRLHKVEFPRGYDVLIIAKKEAGSLSLFEVVEELEEIFFDKELFV